MFINTFHECQINLWTDSNSMERLEGEKLFQVRDITRRVVRAVQHISRISMPYLSRISMPYLSRISMLYLNIFRLEFMNSEIIKNESFVAASDLMRYEVNISNK